MTAGERYLFCAAGGTPFLLRARCLRHIWTRSEPAPDEFQSVEPTDLCERLGKAAGANAIALGLDMPGGANILLVDRIGGFAEVSEDEFQALPSVFAFARELFDAACAHSVEGVHPLRLRLGA